MLSWIWKASEGSWERETLEALRTARTVEDRLSELAYREIKRVKF